MNTARHSSGDAPFAGMHETRRAFFKKLGGGIFIFFSVGPRLALGEEPVSEAAMPVERGYRDFNAFLRIGADGRVTCLTGKIEMGQGVMTSLPQMLADELDVPLDKVDIIMGDTDLTPYDAGTWGSLTTRKFGPNLRAAAAEAREVLVEMAAEKLGLPKEALVTRDGAVFARDDESRRVTYAELVEGKTIERHLSRKPVLKDASEFRVMGKPQHRRDGHEKVTGRALYTADIRLPGMLYASVLRPPAHGARLKQADTRKAAARDGVRVVEDGDFIAVLHATPDGAMEAIGDVKADWDLPPLEVTEETIHDHLMTVQPEPHTVGEGGDLEAGRAAAAQRIATTFRDAYVAHSPLETHAALANLEGDKMTVWASTQNPFGARDLIAKSLGLPQDKVRVITPFVGGGFGGKTSNLQAVEAARLARHIGAPVQVMRTREEEFAQDTFRPASITRIDAGLDADGRITYWDYEVNFAGERGSELFYAIPNHRTVARPRGWTAGPGTHPFPTGAWRAPGANSNGFARESQIDILAAAAAMDPVDFRLRHLKHAQIAGVLRIAADKWGWVPARAPSGRGLGVACGTDAGTFVAAIGEVAVDRQSGKVQVKRVLVVQDMGLVVNPLGATLQVEGCIMMGIGYALFEEIHFKGGRVLDTNFNRYDIPRFTEVPTIDCVLLDRPEAAPQGGGEPAITVMGGLIANAIHDATGVRLTRMPMTAARLKQALAGA